MPRKFAFVAVVLFVFILALSMGQSQQKKKPTWKPSPHVAATEAKSPEEQRQALRVPKGFEIQLVAAEPHIKNPMNIAFDAKGRLWVTMSSEYPFPNGGKKTKDTVKILEDFGPDGRARKITTFAENLNIPIGVLPLNAGNEAIVFSIPNIWLLQDTDGDGKADTKKILLKEYGQRDTHGLTGEFQMGFDGWVYACHGFSNSSTVVGTDGSKIHMHSGNTYRFKPDGSRLNYHTHGQVNPFGLAFDPLGNLFSCDCHTQPIYQLLRGAWYPSFAKPHDGLGFGPPMMTNHHGSTAIAGIAYYAANEFPKEYRDNTFIGNVVTCRVNRDSLVRIGSTYRAKRQPDFVVSKDPWFRPVDVKQGPDGALYICDFYNRIIGHYEVPLTHPGRDRDHGRIWRVVYRGKRKDAKPQTAMTDFTAAKTKDLIADLANPSLRIRLFATNELVRRGGKDITDAAKAVLKTSKNQYGRIHGLWVLDRQNALDDDLLIASAQDNSATVRVHAMRVLAERSKLTENQRMLAIGLLKDKDAFVQRTAALVLSEHPDGANLSPLLVLRDRAPKADSHLVHVARMAVRDQFKLGSTWKTVALQKWSEEYLRYFADGMLSLGNQNAASFLTSHLPVFKARRRDYVKHISRYGDAETRKSLRETLLRLYEKDRLAQAEMIRAIHQGSQERAAPLDKTTVVWARTLVDGMMQQNRNHKLSAIELMGRLRLSHAQKHLRTVLENPKEDLEIRNRTATALMRINPKSHFALLSKILVNGAEREPLRRNIVNVLSESNIPAARKQLIESLTFAPAPLQLHIAINLAASRDGADRLLDAVAKGKASARLLQNREVQARMRRANPPMYGQRFAKLTKGLPSVNAQLLSLLKKRINGFRTAKADIEMGAKLYEKNCAACHQLQNKGGKIAPQLDGVGVRGPERLLEDILDPNRNVDQQFRSTVLVKKNGQVFSGLFIRQDGNVLVMADEKGKEQRIDKNDVDQRLVAPTSPMPSNLGEQISETELYHLLAFLLEQRVKSKKP